VAGAGFDVVEVVLVVVLVVVVAVVDLTVTGADVAENKINCYIISSYRAPSLVEIESLDLQYKQLIPASISILISQ